MRSSRVVLSVFALLVAAPPAGAQRWGGGGPGVSRPVAPARVATHVRVVFLPYVPMQSGVTTQRQPTNGGTWDGRRPTIGGSPPVQPRQPLPDYGGFFSYAPSRGQIIVPTSEPVLLPAAAAESLDARRRRRMSGSRP